MTPELNLPDKAKLILLKLVGKTLSSLGFQGTAKFAQVMGGLLWHAMPKRRAIAVHNITTQLNLNLVDSEKLARLNFTHTARSFMEIGLIPQFGLHSPLLTIEDPENLTRLKKITRPVVIASGHIGSWELMAALFGSLTSPERPGVVVTRQSPDRALQAFIASCRSVQDTKIIGHHAVAADVLKTLRRNGLAGFLVDQRSKAHEATWLPFLNQPAAVNIGPALLAIRAQALIWPFFLVRQGEGYLLVSQKPLDTVLLEGSRDDKVHQAATFYTQAAEQVIRRFPEQWYWIHDRWKNNHPS